MTTDVRSTAESLRRARALYAEAPSHAPFMTCPSPGTFCVCTALDRASWSDDAQNALARAAGLGHDVPTRIPLIKWNADASTAEVLAAFDRAIAEAESA